MEIRIDEKVFSLVGDIHNKKESHKSDGICNVLRVAYIYGKIKEDKFYSNDFRLIESPE